MRTVPVRAPWRRRPAVSPCLQRLRTSVEIVRAQPAPGAFLASRLLMRSGLCRLFTIPQDGFRLRFYPSSLSAALWIAPRSRSTDADFFRRYLRLGEVAIDVGANIGSLAIVAALSVGRLGRVVAVEAHPRTASFLLGNVALNELTNVEVQACALGVRPGRARLTDRRSDDHNRITSDAGVDVPVRRLDDVDTTRDEISLLKIDVEGYELPVLEGGPALLERTQCVYFESWEAQFAKFGYSTPDVLTRLERAGFTCLRRVEGATLRVVRPSYRSLRRENILAVRSVPRLTGRTGWQVATR